MVPGGLWLLCSEIRETRGRRNPREGGNAGVVWTSVWADPRSRFQSSVSKEFHETVQWGLPLHEDVETQQGAISISLAFRCIPGPPPTSWCLVLSPGLHVMDQGDISSRQGQLDSLSRNRNWEVPGHSLNWSTVLGGCEVMLGRWSCPQGVDETWPQREEEGTPNRAVRCSQRTTRMPDFLQR